MPPDDSLKRLGGGRWETRDGRFAIEPQSGTWVVVDNLQTDELGLPLVRGPFGSLTAAREAIDGARNAGPAESPLAHRLKEAKTATVAKAASTATAGRPKPDSKPARETASAPSAPEQPERPPEPKWLRDLAPAERRRARDLIARLQELHVDNADAIARAEIALDQPALTALAIERALGKVMTSAKDADAAVRAATRVLIGGRDPRLDVRWRLVDDRGRPVTDLDLPDLGSN